MPATAVARFDYKATEVNQDAQLEFPLEEYFREGLIAAITYPEEQAQFDDLIGNKADPSTVGALGSESIPPGAGSVVPFPKPPSAPPPPQWILEPLQEWEGHVLDRSEQDFTARLVDLTVQTSWLQEEEAVIPLSEIADDDLERLRPGNVFRWIIGYERSVFGNKRRVSQIVFRDLPAMTKQDWSDGEAWADKIAQSRE